MEESGTRGRAHAHEVAAGVAGGRALSGDDILRADLGREHQAGRRIAGGHERVLALHDRAGQVLSLQALFDDHGAGIGRRQPVAAEAGNGDIFGIEPGDADTQHIADRKADAVVERQHGGARGRVAGQAPRRAGIVGQRDVLDHAQRRIGGLRRGLDLQPRNLADAAHLLGIGAGIDQQQRRDQAGGRDRIGRDVAAGRFQTEGRGAHRACQVDLLHLIAGPEGEMKGAVQRQQEDARPARLHIQHMAELGCTADGRADLDRDADSRCRARLHRNDVRAALDRLVEQQDRPDGDQRHAFDADRRVVRMIERQVDRNMVGGRADGGDLAILRPAAVADADDGCGRKSGEFQHVEQRKVRGGAGAAARCAQQARLRRGRIGLDVQHEAGAGCAFRHHARDVEALPPVGEESFDGVRQVAMGTVGIHGIDETLDVQTSAEPPVELADTGDEDRDVLRAPLGQPDHRRGAGTHTFDRPWTAGHFFHIDTGR